MVKKSGSPGPGSQKLQTPSGQAVKTDSKPAGERGSGTWINERGEVCIGSECFTLAISPNAEEVVIRVDRNKCGADLQPIIDAVFTTIGKGGRTVYESTSKIKD